MKHLFSLASLCLVSASCVAQSEPPLQESPGASSALGYTDVSEALASLKAKPGVTVNVTKPDGWIIVTESAPTLAIWSFAPQGHYAYPTVVRRTIKQDSSGGVGVEMVALCKADKEACDRLIREFQQLNERMREQVQLRLKQGKGGQ